MKHTYTITGMTCNGCRSSVEKALNSIKGIEAVVSLDPPISTLTMKDHMPLVQSIDTSKMIMSPMPGVIYSINVKVGDEVVPGQEVCIVEAMKMQNALRTETAGKVKAVHVKKGQTVNGDQVLIEFA